MEIIGKQRDCVINEKHKNVIHSWKGNIALFSKVRGGNGGNSGRANRRKCYGRQKGKGGAWLVIAGFQRCWFRTVYTFTTL